MEETDELLAGLLIPRISLLYTGYLPHSLIFSARLMPNMVRIMGVNSFSLEPGQEEGVVARLIEKPELIKADGNKTKIIEEFIGRVSCGIETLSVARMKSPAGWVEPGQTPDFDEYTVVLKGCLRVKSKTGRFLDVKAGQAVIVSRGEWVQYSSPGAEGAEYVAVCSPAFSPSTVHRDG